MRQEEPLYRYVSPMRDAFADALVRARKSKLGDRVYRAFVRMYGELRA